MVSYGFLYPVIIDCIFLLYIFNLNEAVCEAKASGNTEIVNANLLMIEARASHGAGQKRANDSLAHILVMNKKLEHKGALTPSGGW